MIHSSPLRPRAFLCSLILFLLSFSTLHCGSGETGNGSNSGGSGGKGGGPAGPTIPSTPQDTRFRITNSCQSTIWIQQQNMPSNTPAVIQLASGASYDFDIPDAGLASTRFWPKTGCDSTMQNCAIGQSSSPCPAVGCAPPVDSKMEATWGCVLDPSQCAMTPQGNVIPAVTSFNASGVDGYTLPFKVNVNPSDGNTCNNFDCSNLSLNSCPMHENLSQGTPGNSFPQYNDENLQVLNPGNGAVAGCFSPCIKFNYPTWGGLNVPNNQSDPEVMYCCPTPPISSAQCQAGPAPGTQYVGLIHSACTGGVYGYAYDDGIGLHNCNAPTQIEMVFGPNCP